MTSNEIADIADLVMFVMRRGHNDAFELNQNTQDLINFALELKEEGQPDPDIRKSLLSKLKKSGYNNNCEKITEWSFE